MNSSAKKENSHDCIQTVNIALLKDSVPRFTIQINDLEKRLVEKIDGNLSTVTDFQKEIKRSIDDIAIAIKGDGKQNVGLVSKVLMNQKSVRRLWGLLIILSTAIISVVIKVIFFGGPVAIGG